jgi:hypothetical protein
MLARCRRGTLGLVAARERALVSRAQPPLPTRRDAFISREALLSCVRAALDAGERLVTSGRASCPTRIAPPIADRGSRIADR